MRKFLFLDIDGVLNSDEYFNEHHYLDNVKTLIKNGMDREIAAYVGYIDPSKVELINKITVPTITKIVLSSSWRTCVKIKEILKAAGIIRPLYDVTPYTTSRNRGQEIQDWLNRHADPEDTYLIIDDDNDILNSQTNHLVQTDWRYGLLEEQVEECLSILNNPLCNVGGDGRVVYFDE